MAILAKDERGPRERPTLGIHDAICVFVVDVGTHTTKTQFGEKTQHKVVFCWELDENIKNGEYAGKPFMVSKRYTLSLFKKANLAEDLESWMAKKIPDETRKAGIDLEIFKGRKCTINLVESADGEYVNVGSVLPANKDNKLVPLCVEIPAWINKLKMVSLEATQGDNWGDGTPLPSDADAPPQEDDDLPF